MLGVNVSEVALQNFKELEKLGPKKGIISQSVKEILQSLVDDNLVMSSLSYLPLPCAYSSCTVPKRLVLVNTTGASRESALLTNRQTVLDPLQSICTINQNATRVQDERAREVASST